MTRPGMISDIVYASRSMGEIIDRIESSRDSLAPALITGETGTGKELIARAVHDASSRRKQEFIPFNCGAAPPELIVSELFGYKRGSFTGASGDYKGVIRTADGGTLFLDEIGDLPLAAQAMTLRFLQEGEVRPLGEARPIKVNVRVIAATNRDLEADVQSGQFRADLFWRLNKLRLRIPPLHERREDIPVLIEHFLCRHQEDAGRHGQRLSDEARALMFDYQWPGNVREIENVLYRLVAFAVNGDPIGPERFLEEIGVSASPPATNIVEGRIVIDARLSYRERQKELERLSIIGALNDTGGNIRQASAKLGMCRNSLRDKIKKFGIDRTTAAYESHR